LFEKYEEVFKPGLGTLKEMEAKIMIREDVEPIFLKARQLPYALKAKVEAELDQLEQEGVLCKVDHSEWATPIVPVVKRDNTVRICGDFKTTLNPRLRVDQYPLPRIEDIFASLARGQMFSKIDLKQAYLQMSVQEDCRKYLTINTHRGLYRYNRLVFGIASAPAIWQRAIEQVLQGISNVQCILDDMIITGRNDEEHIDTLCKVLERLQKYGLRVNLKKCAFFQERIVFCGHEIDRHGLHKTKDKVDAILQAPRPTNQSQLRSFNGLVNYYAKFLPNLSTIMRPLNRLLEKGMQWVWSCECEEAFGRVKQLVASDKVLVHYDPTLPIRLACDASPYGLGAVLSHITTDGIERPIAFVSRSLTATERNYAQIDKEALGLYWATKKFYAYLYGRHFTLITDHQPLVSIFHPTKAFPAMTAARLQRYAMFLSGLDYTIEFRESRRHGNADALSRLPLITGEMNEPDAADVFTLTQMEVLPVTHAIISRALHRDPLLSRVFQLTSTGWTVSAKTLELTPFYIRRSELSIHQGCLMWGGRVIVPQKLRQRILDQLHEAHSGVVKMKSLARSYVWWPGIDADIEKITQACQGCMNTQKEPAKVPLHPWEYPSKPWQRVHIDYCVPL
jgi:hypothetical protein